MAVKIHIIKNLFNKAWKIQITKTDYTIIDKEDLILFAKYNWHIKKTCRNKYLQTNILKEDKKTTIYFHQLIMGKIKDLETDHINNNGLDNRKSNLRLVTHKENQNNLPKRTNTTSKYKGVSFCKERNNWCTQIYENGKAKTLGRFITEAEAAN